MIVYEITTPRKKFETNHETSRRREGHSVKWGGFTTFVCKWLGGGPSTNSYIYTQIYGGLEDDFDDMGVASWDGGAWNDDGA